MFAVFRTFSNIYDKAFLRKESRISTLVNYFHRKSITKMFNRNLIGFWLYVS